MRILAITTLVFLAGCTQKSKEGVDALEFFAPANGVTVGLVHEKVANSSSMTETLSYQWDKTTNQVNRVHKFSDPQMLEVTEVFQVSESELVKIAHLSSAASKTGLQEKFSDRKITVGDKIEGGKYEIIAVSEKFISPSGKAIEPCVKAVGGKYKTELWFCKGYGLVKQWSSGLPTIMSKGSSIP